MSATMRILLLSFYFRPDLSAGSFRATALVDALLKAHPGVEIDVVTTLPNRYSAFSPDAQPAMLLDRLRCPATRAEWSIRPSPFSASPPLRAAWPVSVMIWSLPPPAA